MAEDGICLYNVIRDGEKTLFHYLIDENLYLLNALINSGGCVSKEPFRQIAETFDDIGCLWVDNLQEDLFAGLLCQPGFRCTRKDLQEDLRTLIATGLFSNVDVRVTPLPQAPLALGPKGKGRARKRYQVTFILSENLWQPLKSFKVVPHPKNKSKTLLIPQVCV